MRSLRGSEPPAAHRLQLEPDHLESLYNLRMVYSDQLQLDKPRDLLEQAIALDPGFANAHVALGVAALRAGDPPGALGPLEKAVVLEGSNPNALATLAQAYLIRQNPQAALPHLRNAAIVAPDDQIVLFSLAQCLLGIEGESVRTRPRNCWGAH